jgi:hypothetical protein
MTYRKCDRSRDYEAFSTSSCISDSLSSVAAALFLGRANLEDRLLPIGTVPIGLWFGTLLGASKYSFLELACTVRELSKAGGDERTGSQRALSNGID